MLLGMATWAKLKEVISKNLKVLSDEGDVLTLVFEFDGGREQHVVVCRAGNNTIGEWAQIESAYELQPGNAAACFTHAAICASSSSPSWMSM